MKKNAIVTLAVGTRFKEMFETRCRLNWQMYCNDYDYDLIVIEQPLDCSIRAQKRSPAWQKLLILSQKWSNGYERIVWLDADIIINNNNAIDISTGVPINKVGAVESYSIPTRELHDISLMRLYNYWEKNNIKYIDNIKPCDYYLNRGIQGERMNEVVQTGVFVCSPIYHRELFEHVYHSYEDSHGAEWNYEMPAMSYELIKSDNVHWISPNFNFCVSGVLAAFYPWLLGVNNSAIGRIKEKIERKLFKYKNNKEYIRAINNIHGLSYFTHFAGCTNLISLVSDEK